MTCLVLFRSLTATITKRKIHRQRVTRKQTIQKRSVVWMIYLGLFPRPKQTPRKKIRRIKISGSLPKVKKVVAKMRSLRPSPAKDKRVIKPKSTAKLAIKPKSGANLVIKPKSKKTLVPSKPKSTKGNLIPTKPKSSKIGAGTNSFDDDDSFVMNDFDDDFSAAPDFGDFAEDGSVMPTKAVRNPLSVNKSPKSKSKKKDHKDKDKKADKKADKKSDKSDKKSDKKSKKKKK